MADIPDWHLEGLGIGPIKDKAHSVTQIEESLARVGTDLAEPRAIYDAMGGDSAVNA